MRKEKFDFCLVQIMDRLIISGMSEADAAVLVGSLLESLLTPEEIEERFTEYPQA